MGEIDSMLDNHKAESWDDLNESDNPLYDDPRADALTRVEAYVEHCFETYPVVSNNLDRGQVQVCIADWGHRRGQARLNERYTRQKFGKQVRNKWSRRIGGNHAVFIATALVGVSAEDDNGAGWKPTVRHELGHVVDYEKRGTSDHSHEFKKIMRQFGHESNDGGYAHGYPPRRHR